MHLHLDISKLFACLKGLSGLKLSTNTCTVKLRSTIFCLNTLHISSFEMSKDCKFFPLIRNGTCQLGLTDIELKSKLLLNYQNIFIH